VGHLSHEEVLSKLVLAGNAQDIEAIVSAFADDGASHEPAGPEKAV
jgi:hypothetical protein